MRESLHKLLSNTIVFEYSLPNKEKEINRSKHTTEKDNCMKVGTTDLDVAKAIFNIRWVHIIISTDQREIISRTHLHYILQK